MCPISEIDYSLMRPATENINTIQKPVAERKTADELPPDTDLVEISQWGRENAQRMAEGASLNPEPAEERTPVVSTSPQLMEEPLPESASTRVLGSMTLDSGRTVTIEKFALAADENSLPQEQGAAPDAAPVETSATAAGPFAGADSPAAEGSSESDAVTVRQAQAERSLPAYGYRAVITSADGQSSQSYLLKSDTIINEDADGVLNISSYTAGAESSGDDLIVGFEGRALRGGSGNDTIIDMSADYNENSGQPGAAPGGAPGSVPGSADIGAASAVIDSGSGDDTVILVGERVMSVSVSTGSGNDTVISTGDIEISRLDTGSGDDTVKVRGNLTIRGGEVGGMESDGFLFKRNSESGPVFRTGSGNDTVEVGGNLDIKGGNVKVTYGKPSENFNVDPLVRGSLDKAIGREVEVVSMDTGSGDDTIRVKGSLEMDGAVIRTGDGDDSIVVENDLIMKSWNMVSGSDSTKSSIDTGDGDDTIRAGGTLYMDNSNIASGSGDDRITAGNIMVKSDSVISTGDGDDTIAADSNLSLHYRSAIITGDGDDTVHAGNMLHMYWEGVMNTGNGDDTISSGRNMTIDVYSLVKTGDGDDTMKAARRFHVDGDSIIHTGEGDDTLKGGRSFSTDGHALVYTSGGSDSITAGRRMHSDGGSGIRTGDGNDYISAGYAAGLKGGLGVHGNSSIDTGDGNDRIDASNLTVTQGSSLRTGNGNDYIRVGELGSGGELDTGAGNDTIDADRIVLWGGSGSGMKITPYSLFEFPEFDGSPFKGISAYQKIMKSGKFDPEELANTRQKYLEGLLRRNGYDGELE